MELLRGADGVHNSSAASRPFWGIQSIGRISLDLKSRGKNCQENCQEKRVVEGKRDLPRLVDFLSKSAIFVSFIEQNRPIPTTGSIKTVDLLVFIENRCGKILIPQALSPFFSN